MREILRGVNRHFYKSTPASHYATAFFAIYDPSTRHAALFCAHRKVAGNHRGGERHYWRRLRCRVETITLEPGDTLLVFSDGITEAGIDRGEEFGEARVQALLEGLHLGPVAEVLPTT